MAMPPLRYHPEQSRLFHGTARFRTVPAGRRGGKTEIAKRFVVHHLFKAKPGSRYFVGAPTFSQAKSIWWDDLKAYTKGKFRVTKSETELKIRMINGNSLQVLGMDKPERAEGVPWDGGILDEYGNMKKNVWTEALRPALSDRQGWCWFIGVPEGRNHYYDLDRKSIADKTGTWEHYGWPSSDILPASEIAQAKEDLDELTYMQEYEASFLNFSGRAYYSFDENTHCARLEYNPNNRLVFCFDFNVDPGTATIIQEQNYVDPKTQVPIIGEHVTGVIGEVYIPRNSNTIRVCDKLIQDWGDHRGQVFVYGDSTGGNRGSAKVQGSDWDLVKAKLKPVFEERLFFKVPTVNPRERARLNAMNSRMKTMSGSIKLQVDPSKAPKTLKDFEGVALLEGGSGEIDKKSSPELTHLSDGVGYYVYKEYPVKGKVAAVQKLQGF